MQAHRFGLVALATLSLGVAFSPLAQARDYTVTGQNGRSTQVDVTRQRTQNGTSFGRTTTLPNGQTSSGSGSFTRTGNGGYERNVQLTGPNGRQTTVNGTGTYQDGVLNGTRNVTYPNGQTRTTTIRSNP
jgi:hypothetical protein